MRPGQTIEVVESSPRREWFWKRALRVFSIRNLRLEMVDSLAAWAETHRESVDLLLTKHLEPAAALSLGLPLLRPGGRLLSWQRTDRLHDVRRPIFDPRGQRIEVEESYPFVSAVARPRTLLCLGCVDVAETTTAKNVQPA